MSRGLGDVYKRQTEMRALFSDLITISPLNIVQWDHLGVPAKAVKARQDTIVTATTKVTIAFLNMFFILKIPPFFIHLINVSGI